MDALVLDARLRQSLVAVRSLGRHGLLVAGVERSAHAPAFRSRWCRVSLVCPADEGSVEYLDWLETVVDGSPAAVLIPSADSTVDLLRRHRTRIEQRARVALAHDPALGIAIDKEQTLAIAQTLGIRVPQTIAIHTVDDVRSAVRAIGLPAVVKPCESWLQGSSHGVRVASEVVTSVEEAHRAVAMLVGLGGGALLQPLLTGRREAVSLMSVNGLVHARFAQWAKRTAPPLGGESVLRQSIAVPDDIGADAERLVSAIELDGYAEVEFRRDAEGRPHLMEINPRLSASVEIAVRSGVDFPWLLHQWAAGERVPTIESYRTGGWMRYLGGDITTTIASLRHRGRPEVTPALTAVASFFASFLTPMAYDYLDWTDLSPAVAASTEFLWQTAASALKLALATWTAW